MIFLPVMACDDQGRLPQPPDTKRPNMEINDIVIGQFKVDLFINDLGNLGISVSSTQAPEKVRDIFVEPSLAPEKIHVG
jgi:hypothetical protein